MVGAIFKFSPLSSLSWSNVPSNEVVSSSRRPITCKRRLHLFRRGLFYDDGPPPRHSWQCWHLQWTIWPLRSPSRSTLCLGQPEQDDQKSRQLPFLNFGNNHVDKNWLPKKINPLPLHSRVVYLKKKIVHNSSTFGQTFLTVPLQVLIISKRQTDNDSRLRSLK